MFKLKRAQKEVFSDAARRDFEDRMVAHLNKYFPVYCEPLGEERVRRLLAYGVERASSYGIVAERGVCVYVDAMFSFGRDFDADPRFPWAAAVLTDRALRDPLVRADRLFDAAYDHIEEAPGLAVQAELDRP